MSELRADEGITRADEVADLDPYNVRNTPIKDSGKELVGDEAPEEEEYPLEEPAEEESLEDKLRKREKDEWEKVLGVDVRIKPFPREPIPRAKGFRSIITPERLKKLNALGFDLIYMPQLDENLSITAGIAFAIPSQGIKIQTTLQALFPNWKAYESLTDQQKEVRSNYRNINNWFWEEVQKRKIELPELPGQWMAIELEQDNEYSVRSPLNKYLAIGRRAASYNDAQKILNDASSTVLQGELDLEPGQAELRLPNALEANLCLNRLEQRTANYEWTSTSHTKIFGRKGKIIMAGAEDSIIASPEKVEHHFSDIKFRAVVAFK